MQVYQHPEDVHIKALLRLFKYATHSSAGFGIRTLVGHQARLGSVCATAAISLRKATGTFVWRVLRWVTICAGGIAIAHGLQMITCSSRWCSNSSVKMSIPCRAANSFTETHTCLVEKFNELVAQYKIAGRRVVSLHYDTSNPAVLHSLTRRG